MTEEEAKEKWCPMVRFDYTRARDGEIVGYTSSRKYGEGSASQSFCIGSACMMWRKESTIMLDRDGRQCSPEQMYTAMDTGFCGLAGKP